MPSHEASMRNLAKARAKWRAPGRGEASTKPE
jgi:hypothetical protein